VESLDHAHKFIESSQDARFFVEKYMKPIIGILVEQQPGKDWLSRTQLRPR
jgi:hypothetical protein